MWFAAYFEGNFWAERCVIVTSETPGTGKVLGAGNFVKDVKGIVESRRYAIISNEALAALQDGSRLVIVSALTN